jgi:hypothetical protein
MAGLVLLVLQVARAAALTHPVPPLRLKVYLQQALVDLGDVEGTAQPAVAAHGEVAVVQPVEVDLFFLLLTTHCLPILENCPLWRVIHQFQTF